MAIDQTKRKWLNAATTIGVALILMACAQKGEPEYAEYDAHVVKLAKTGYSNDSLGFSITIPANFALVRCYRSDSPNEVTTLLFRDPSVTDTLCFMQVSKYKGMSNSLEEEIKEIGLKSESITGMDYLEQGTTDRLRYPAYYSHIRLGETSGPGIDGIGYLLKASEDSMFYVILNAIPTSDTIPREKMLLKMGGLLACTRGFRMNESR